LTDPGSTRESTGQPNSASTPINVDRLELELVNHPDREFVTELITGLRNGFHMKISNSPTISLECKNLQSALLQPDVVDNLIADELKKGYMVGPFDQLPFPVYRVSPIGIAEGKYSKKQRMILDLSSPHEETSPSINDLIDKSECTLSYVKIDDVIQSIVVQGKGAQLCKTDISDAFKFLFYLANGICFV